jgi:hypothetical protein
MATKKVNKATEPDNLFDKFMRTTQYATDLDRYSDFKSLFLATEQGRRVFNEILGMGYMAHDPIKYNKAGVDVNATLIATGERKMALAIHRLTMIEPPPPPPKTQKTRR